MPETQLIIRPVEASDREDYYAIFSNPEITRYDDFDPVTYEELDSVLQTAIDSHRTRIMEYGVATYPEDRLIGILTVHKKRKYSYLGYHFNALFHCRGYATRALNMMLATFTPAEKAVSRLAIHPDNAASIAVARKTGFVESHRRGPAHNPEIIFVNAAVTVDQTLIEMDERKEIIA